MPIAKSLCFGIQSSGKSLTELANRKRLRDCAIIARAIFETLTNVLYLYASDRSVVQDMIDHAKSKLARDLKRDVQAGSVTMSIRNASFDEISSRPDNRRAIDRFTRRSGKEMRHWTDVSLSDRLDSIEKRFGTKVTTMLCCAFENYRFSSEVLHGTVYSICAQIGGTALGHPQSPEEFEHHTRENVYKLLLTHGASLGQSAIVLANDDTVDKIVRRVKAAQDEAIGCVLPADEGDDQ